MCGIVGVVGESTLPRISHRLFTSLLAETEVRGPHATGYFLVNNKNEVDHLKIGVNSRKFIGFRPWKNVGRTIHKAMLAHTRWATHGSPRNPLNNHPFVSPTENIGFCHNGILQRYEFFKDDTEWKHLLKGECDSELILRIIVKENNIVKGIEKVYEMFGHSGDFACELIYRDQDNQNPNTKFYFWRDPGRPGRFIDARNVLGQYFFCSTAEIWHEAVKRAHLTKILGHLEVKHIPPYEIWVVQSESLEIDVITIDQPKRRMNKAKMKRKDLQERRSFRTRRIQGPWQPICRDGHRSWIQNHLTTPSGLLMPPPDLNSNITPASSNGHVDVRDMFSQHSLNPVITTTGSITKKRSKCVRNEKFEFHNSLECGSNNEGCEDVIFED